MFTLSLSLSFLTLNCTAQSQIFGTANDDYSFTLGGKTLSPPENIKNFSALKKELNDNLYNEWYYVVVQFYKQPTMADVSEMNTQISTLSCVNKLTCISAVSDDMKAKILKRHGVRAVLPLTPELKIQQNLFTDINSNEEVSVNIVVPANIDLDFVKGQLASKGATASLEFLAESVRKYIITASKSEIEAIAALPYVLQIQTGGMR